jgi:hypothetical protein
LSNQANSAILEPMATPENRPNPKRHEMLFGDIKKELDKPGAETVMFQAFSDYVELRDAQIQLFKRTENLTTNMDLKSQHSRRVRKAGLHIDEHIKNDLEEYAEGHTIMSGLVGKFIGTYEPPEGQLTLYKEGPFTKQEQALDKLKAVRKEFRDENGTKGHGGQRI